MLERIDDALAESDAVAPEGAEQLGAERERLAIGSARDAIATYRSARLERPGTDEPCGEELCVRLRWRACLAIGEVADGQVRAALLERLRGIGMARTPMNGTEPDENELDDEEIDEARVATADEPEEEPEPAEGDEPEEVERAPRERASAKRSGRKPAAKTKRGPSKAVAKAPCEACGKPIAPRGRASHERFCGGEKAESRGAADPLVAVRALLDAWEKLPRAARSHVLGLLGASA